MLCISGQHSSVSLSIDICTVAIKNIRNMHAASTNQISDILRLTGVAVEGFSPTNAFFDAEAETFYVVFMLYLNISCCFWIKRATVFCSYLLQLCYLLLLWKSYY